MCILHTVPNGSTCPSCHGPTNIPSTLCPKCMVHQLETKFEEQAPTPKENHVIKYIDDLAACLVFSFGISAISFALMGHPDFQDRPWYETTVAILVTSATLYLPIRFIFRRKA